MKYYIVISFILVLILIASRILRMVNIYMNKQSFLETLDVNDNFFNEQRETKDYKESKYKLIQKIKEKYKF
jgi:hypothetical protein